MNWSSFWRIRHFESSVEEIHSDYPALEGAANCYRLSRHSFVETYIVSSPRSIYAP